jgi:hypothetical protein
MKTLTEHSFREHLSELGVEILTGEACPHRMRLLTDISPGAKDRVEAFFGMKLSDVGCNGWTKKDGEWKPGSYADGEYERGHSMMLPREAAGHLLVYLLLQKFHAVVKTWAARKGGFSINGTLFAMEKGEYIDFIGHMENRTSEPDSDTTKAALFIRRNELDWTVYTMHGG